MNREKIISTLCGNDFNTDCSNCHGLLNLKCHQDHYCDLRHLSEQQVQYILSDINSDVYLNACPGSGKTEVVGVKCAYEMTLWNKRSAGMAILTFTNSAENELRERVSSYYRKQPDYPHFLGTFTSWLHGYIANPFLYLETGHGDNKHIDTSIQIIDSDCTSDFIKAFKTQNSCGKTLHNISANEYFYNAKEQRYQYNGKFRNGKEEFQTNLTRLSWMKKDVKETKRRFWKSGFFLYEDVEVLSYILLKKHPEITSLVSKRFPFIIVDECQDLSYIQILILSILNEYGSHLHFVGDLDQSIYGFRDIEPKDIKDFIVRKNLKEMVLDENYRSNQSIVDASKLFIRRMQNVHGMIPTKVTDPLVILLYKKGQESLLIQRYLDLLKTNNLNANDCRIIVRNNSLRSKLYGNKHLSESETINIVEDYAYAVYLFYSNVPTEYQERIWRLSRAIQRSFFPNSTHDSKAKLYCPKELSESTWRTIILLVQNVLLQSQEVCDLHQTWEKWKNTLKKLLLSIDSPLLPTLESKILRLRPNSKDNIVYDNFAQKSHSLNETPIKIETIHSCKGMSLDSVLFVSSYQRGQNDDSGNYWKEWFPKYTANTITESNRLAYVASSRARHMLVLGIPNPSSSPLSEMDKTYLHSCGFQIYDCTKD